MLTKMSDAIYIPEHCMGFGNKDTIYLHSAKFNSFKRVREINKQWVNWQMQRNSKYIIHNLMCIFLFGMECVSMLILPLSDYDNRQNIQFPLSDEIV